ncbi:MAG: carbohydrate binding domain-containing protein, partial [Clostridiales bacterium]|nr:carbohydrate binding domain-containing protein [Clostridiales bacterium]
MKKIISLALSLVLVSSAFAGSCLSAQETADVDAAQKIGLICSDPGFESNKLTVGYPATDIGMGAWNDDQKNQYNAGLSITDEDAANGKYSLKVKTPNWDKSEFALGLNVERNTVYTLSFKIKTVGANGGLWDSPATMKIGEPSISAKNELVYRNITDNQVINDTRRTGWQQRYFTFNSGNADLVHMYFGSCDAGKLQVNSTMYLDDISLEKITDNGIIEPLANGSGFEEPLETFMPVMSGNGTMPSWTEIECNKFNGGVSQSAENPHSGNYSCKILTPWNIDESGIGIAAFNVCADTDYVFNFWARCDEANANSNANVTVNELVGIGWATTNYSATPLMSPTVFGKELSNGWKQFTYVFHSKNPATVHLVIKGLDSNKPIYLDD